MKFKPNYVNNLIIAMITLFISIYPMLLAIFLIIDPSVVKDFLPTIPGLFIISILFIVGSNLINFVIGLFIKPKMYIYQEGFIYKNKEYKYIDISKMEFDIGSISRTRSDPCVLTLYLKNKGLLEIRHPSIIMTLIIKKRSYDAPLRIKGWKWLLVMIAISTGIGLMIGLLGIIGG
ncbi:MAG: hypothetical protein IJX78_02020 [Bacilli bacterium]|nr:hypothetical protein [Bacilli bacterium]